MSKSTVQASEVSKPRRPQRLLWIGLIVVVVLGVVVVKLRNKTPPAAATAGCSDAVLQKGAFAITSGSVERLNEVSNEIKQLPKYDQDPNCLYVVLTYYIDTSNAAPAANYLSKLEKVYNPAVGYAPPLVSTHAKPPKDLHQIVDFLQQRSNQKFSPSGAPL